MKIVSYRLIMCLLCVWTTGAFATLDDAQRLYEQGRNSEAMDEVNNLLAARPKDAELRFLKGIIHAESGDSDKAVEVFAGLTQDYPELPEPWNNLAVLFAERGEFDKARESLLAAIQTHPSYSTAHENLGDLYARMAGMAYDRALEKDRQNDSARLKLSAVNGLFAAPGWAGSGGDKPIVVAAAEPKPVPKPVVARPEPKPVPKPVVSQPDPKPVVAQPQPTTTPVIKPVPKPVNNTNVNADLTRAVNAWATAWSAQDVQTYLNSYSPNYRPANGASHQAWAAYRRDRLTSPKIIEVDLSNIQISGIDGDTATATFNQKYRSDNYRDEVTKVLTFSKIDGAWRIISEVSQ